MVRLRELRITNVLTGLTLLSNRSSALTSMNVVLISSTKSREGLFIT